MTAILMIVINKMITVSGSVTGLCIIVMIILFVRFCYHQHVHFKAAVALGFKFLFDSAWSSAKTKGPGSLRDLC